MVFFKIRQQKRLRLAQRKILESFVKLMSKNSISGQLTLSARESPRPKETLQVAYSYFFNSCFTSFWRLAFQQCQLNGCLYSFGLGRGFQLMQLALGYTELCVQILKAGMNAKKLTFQLKSWLFVSMLRFGLFLNGNGS